MLLLTSNQKCQSTEGKSWCIKQLTFRQLFTLETGSWEADGDSTASLHQREAVDLLNVTCPSCPQHSHVQHQVAVTGQRSGTADLVQCWTYVNTAVLQWHCRPCTVLNLRQYSHASVTLQTLYSVEPASTQPCFSDTATLYRGCGLSLGVSVSRCINVSSRSRLHENCQRLGLVSAIDISCPRPIFRQILQVTIIKLIKSVVAVDESLAELV